MSETTRKGPHCSSTCAMTVSVSDAGDDAAHPVAGRLVGDDTHRGGPGDLLRDGGDVGPVHDEPAGVVVVAREAPRVHHPAHGVVRDPEQDAASVIRICVMRSTEPPYLRAFEACRGSRPATANSSSRATHRSAENSIEQTIDIPAPPDAVWDVVVAADQYDQWNPFYAPARAPAAVRAPTHRHHPAQRRRP